MAETKLPELTLTLKLLAPEGPPFLLLRLDDTPLGLVQDVRLRVEGPARIPVLEVEQIIYSRNQLDVNKLLAAFPGVKYTPIFMDGQGNRVEEKDAWFMEDHPEHSLAAYAREQHPSQNELVCTCGEDDSSGPALPHKTTCPKS